MENGLLLSCSYDKTVKVWNYSRQLEIDSFTKNDELRCMDYLSDSGTLLLGTNSPAILAHKIEKYMNYGDFDDDDMDMI